MSFIQVDVRLYATLRRYRPRVALGKSFPVRLPMESSLGQLLQELGIPQEEMKQAFVNGIIQETSYKVADGDSIGIFPPIAGGASSGNRTDLRSNITQLVDRLEADNLVRRVHDPDDRRSVLAEISAEGKQRHAAGRRALEQTEQEILNGLPPGDREKLSALLGR